jgi:hydroxymethylpyrimidine/phosphomethylpyrimidine kinase
MIPVALTIAGSDPSGGAGIQADLKTFHAFGVYGAAVVARLTAQNTTGVRGLADVAPAFVVAQLDAVLDDLTVTAAKTGLLGSAAVVEAVADRLRARPLPQLVVDPVLVATTGQALGDPDALAAIRRRLLPLATLITPNLAEAEALVGRPVRDVDSMRDAARALVDLGAGAALVKGGHLDGPPRDVLLAGGVLHDLEGERVAVGRTHGTGCTLSAAITAELASERALVEAVTRARRYVLRALATAPALGRGSRPLDHLVRPND